MFHLVNQKKVFNFFENELVSLVLEINSRISSINAGFSGLLISKTYWFRFSKLLILFIKSKVNSYLPTPFGPKKSRIVENYFQNNF